MTQEDLRPAIGDWFNGGGIDHQITKNELKLWLDGHLKLKPIKLSEEWLLKARFERENSMYLSRVISGRKYLIEYSPNGKWAFRFRVTPSESYLIAAVEYVHELQGLIIALNPISHRF